MRRQFTEEEIAALAANPYTLKVTPGKILFTDAFRTLFRADARKQMAPRAIFRKYGYDPDLLGDSRIAGFRQSLKKEEAGNGDADNAAAAGEATAARLRELEKRVETLEQELQFLQSLVITKNYKL